MATVQIPGLPGALLAYATAYRAAMLLAALAWVDNKTVR